jgi:HAD superfamily hydrolase (TIGR01509 family)
MAASGVSLLAPVRGVVLDVDGTLVDSNDAHARAWVEAFTDHGVDARFEDVRALIGKGGDKLIPEIAGIEESSGRGEMIGARRSEIFQKRYVPNLRAFEGARELLHRMKREGLALAVASSAKKEELDKLLDIIGVKDLLEAKTSSDDGDESKPDPDIVEAALRRLGLRKFEVLMLGDTPYDIEAATRAGIETIALRSGGWGDDKLEGAIAIYDDTADLLVNFDSSPLARKHPDEDTVLRDN